MTDKITLTEEQAAKIRELIHEAKKHPDPTAWIIQQAREKWEREHATHK